MYSEKPNFATDLSKSITENLSKMLNWYKQVLEQQNKSGPSSFDYSNDVSHSQTTLAIKIMS